MKIEIEDRIYWYHSRKANRDFPVYVFGGDTDMATQGKASLTSLERNEVVIIDAHENPPFDSDGFESRINVKLGRVDLRLHRLREIPGKHAEFEPLDIYDVAQAVPDGREQSIAEFLWQGGRITGVDEPVTGLPTPKAPFWRRAFFSLLSLVPLALGFWIAARIGILCRQGDTRYGWDFANSVPLFNWRTAEGWGDAFWLLGHELFFAACMGAAYWLLRVHAIRRKDFLKGFEGWLFYTALIGSVLAMIVLGRLM